MIAGGEAAKSLRSEPSARLGISQPKEKRYGSVEFGNVAPVELADAVACL